MSVIYHHSTVSKAYHRPADDLKLAGPRLVHLMTDSRKRARPAEDNADTGRGQPTPTSHSTDEYSNTGDPANFPYGKHSTGIFV